MSVSLVNPYCTEEEVYRQMAKPYSSSDANIDLIRDCINNASRMIDQKTARIYYQKSITNEVVDIYSISDTALYINDNRTTILFPCPIISITSITEDSSNIIENTDFYVYKNEGKIVRDGEWSTSRKGISITGTIGYATTPDFVKGWCKAIAATMTGLWVTSYTDADGNTYTNIRRAYPETVINDMKSNRRIML